MLNRKPMKSAAKTRAKTPTRNRLSIEKSKSRYRHRTCYDIGL